MGGEWSAAADVSINTEKPPVDTACATSLLQVGKYLNRLSDYLFTAARYVVSTVLDTALATEQQQWRLHLTRTIPIVYILSAALLSLSSSAASFFTAAKALRAIVVLLGAHAIRCKTMAGWHNSTVALMLWLDW
jgi:hypothetical protein